MKLFAVPVWGLIYSVMACYMQDSRARAEPSEIVELVQWRGGGWHHGGGGWRGGGGDIGGGIIGGVIGGVIGGMISRPQPYPYQPQPYQPYYQPQQFDPIAYCMQRFRSYNPNTQLYFGYDGQYHPCP